jgi:hypothetical protein
MLSSAIFEFWGHLAYRNCRTFRTRNRESGPTIETALSHDQSQNHRFFEAVTDYAVRLRFSDMTSEQFCNARTMKDLREAGGLLDIQHGDDARLLRDGIALWKPIFSSELLTRALAAGETGDPSVALRDESCFKPPLARRWSHSQWSYLSAIGGYGLALPTNLNDPTDALKALEYVFLSNGMLRHDYLIGMIPENDHADIIEEFAELHARPRWPFWREVESALTDCLLKTLLLVSSLPAESPSSYHKSALQFLDASPRSHRFLVELVTEVRTVAETNKWKFERI